MKYKVTKKQHISKECFVCGTENNSGLKSKFYELENGELMAIFTPTNDHQSYPDRMHGGIIGAILDETIGRAIMVEDPDSWGVTVELNVKYKRPVPVNKPIKVVARITRNTRFIFEGTGEILIDNNVVAATAYAKYCKVSLDKLVKQTGGEESMMVEDLTESPLVVEY